MGRNSRKHGIGNGTVSLFTQRFIDSVINLNLNEGLISWPDILERREISARFANKGMPNCVGILDGTYIVLCQSPAIDGENFWCRKSCYSFNVQLICDD